MKVQINKDLEARDSSSDSEWFNLYDIKRYCKYVGCIRREYVELLTEQNKPDPMLAFLRDVQEEIKYSH